MPVVSKLVHAFRRKRLTGLLITVSLCTLLGACGNDDRPADSTATNTSTNADLAVSHSPSPAQDAPAPAAVTIQTPAVPVNGTDTALSAAASAPLATPVIHTVD
jgi:hypothetical protein